MIDLTELVAEIARRVPETRVFVPEIGQTMRYERGEFFAVNDVRVSALG